MRIVVLCGIIGLVVLSAALPARGQDSTGASAPQTDLRWFDHFVVAGGWITWIASARR